MGNGKDESAYQWRSHVRVGIERHLRNASDPTQEDARHHESDDGARQGGICPRECPSYEEQHQHGFSGEDQPNRDWKANKEQQPDAFQESFSQSLQIVRCSMARNERERHLNNAAQEEPCNGIDNPGCIPDQRDSPATQERAQHILQDRCSFSQSLPSEWIAECLKNLPKLWVGGPKYPAVLEATRGKSLGEDCHVEEFP